MCQKIFALVHLQYECVGQDDEGDEDDEGGGERGVAEDGADVGGGREDEAVHAAGDEVEQAVAGQHRLHVAGGHQPPGEGVEEEEVAAEGDGGVHEVKDGEDQRGVARAHGPGRPPQHRHVGAAPGRQQLLAGGGGVGGGGELDREDVNSQGVAAVECKHGLSGHL